MQMSKLTGMLLLVSILAVGCATNGKQNLDNPTAATGEKLLWQSETPRPGWTLNEPDLEGTDMFFVGLSGNVATEQLSRDEALRNATKRVVNYLGVLAKDKFEKMSTSFGLASDVVNPTDVKTSFEKQVSAGMARHLMPSQWYEEKWDLPTGTGWKSFVLAKIPKVSLENSFNKAVDEQILTMKQKQKQTNDEVAKNQMDKALEAMKKMKESGIDG